MELKFNGSPRPTIGVEIELQILDSQTLDLTPKSTLLINACQEKGLERVKAEIHQSMIEVDSEISLDVKQCKKYLKSRFNRLTAIASELGLQLAVSGTHPFQRWADRLISTHDRYQNLHQKYQWLVRRMNVYGLHVHVGVQSGNQALAVSNALICYLPHLLALSANSPFWQGIDTGMQSSRVNIMESFPLGGNPLFFSQWEDFEYYYKTMERSGAINSIKDLYWHIRPNLQFGTVEFRICDAMSSLDETMALVSMIQCLVVAVCENIEDNTHEWILTKEQLWIAPENQWIAARDGLEGDIIVDNFGKRQTVSDSVLQLIDRLSPIAMRMNCFEELQYLNRIIANGNGSKRQRQVFNETQSLQQVVAVSIEEFKGSLLDDHLDVYEKPFLEYCFNQKAVGSIE